MAASTLPARKLLPSIPCGCSSFAARRPSAPSHDRRKREWRPSRPGPDCPSRHHPCEWSRAARSSEPVILDVFHRLVEAQFAVILERILRPHQCAVGHREPINQPCEKKSYGGAPRAKRQRGTARVVEKKLRAAPRARIGSALRSAPDSARPLLYAFSKARPLVTL